MCDLSDWPSSCSCCSLVSMNIVAPNFRIPKPFLKNLMLSQIVITMRQCIGYIAQWLERLTADQQVPGSNPGVPSLDFLLLRIPSYGVTNQGALEFAFPLHSKLSMPI